MNYPDLEYLKTLKCGTFCYIKKNFPELFIHLQNKYHDTKNFAEKVYMYYHNLEAAPICPICKKHKCRFKSLNLGYASTCSQKCSNINPDKFIKAKKTKLERYGDENYRDKEKTKHTCLERYGAENPFAAEVIKEKIRNINLSNLGVEYPMQSKEVQKKSENTFLEKYGVKHYLESEEGKEKILSKIDKSIEKRNDTCIKKYGVKSAMKLDKIKEKKRQTCIEKYGTEWYTQTEEYKEIMKEKDYIRMQHIYETKRKNNSFHTSRIEQDFKYWLEENNIEYKYQYRTEKYPFNCDFYFPNKDIYIEIQGTWCHGPHPFDPNNSDDIEILKIWETRCENTKSDFYNGAIYCWTEYDPMKREIAYNNQLNFHEIFSYDLDTVVKEFKKIYY